MGKTNISIIGAGGFGREVAAMIQFSSLKEEFKLLGFVDDGLVKGTRINGIDVLGSLEWLKIQTDNRNVVIAVGAPKVREIIANKLESFNFPNIVHPDAKMHDPRNISMGRGNIICDGNILTTNVSLGDFNIINLSCTIGHDATMGNFCSLMPGVNISGGTKLKNGVYVGTGVKLIKMTTLYNGCIVGAGSVVNTDIPSQKTYAGVPAREI